MSTNYNVPVSPYVTSDGHIASLGEVLTTPVSALATPQPPYSFGVVNLTSTTLSASMAASLGFSDLVSFSVSGNAYYWLIDIISTLPALPDPSDGPVLSQVYGVGIRCALKAWSVNTKMSMSAYGLAAQAELGIAQTTFELGVYGAGIEALSTVRPLITVLGSKFEVETMQTLGQCIGDLTDYLASNAQTLTPVLVGINLDFSSPTLLDPAGGYVYALRRITKGNSLTQALQSVPSTLPPGVQINGSIVQAVYTQIVGTDPTAIPTGDEKTTANTLLNTGNF